MQKQCREWAQTCMPRQKAKVGRHTTVPLGQFKYCNRFQHIHVNIGGSLPPSRGFRYTLTIINRKTRWPQAIPTNDLIANNVANIIVKEWVPQFGTSAVITTDHGRQFESALFTKMT